ncbi:MAG: hypothetical protein ACM3QS_11230 [Bacteroidota bacterium]
MRNRRLLWLAGGALILALLLAFPFRGFLERRVILPAAYLLWVLWVFYTTMPQLLWWALAVLVIAFLIGTSLSPGERYAPRFRPDPKPPVGPLEELARSLGKSGDGVYFKWLVANRLGKLAHRMLVQREGNRSRSVFAPLVGTDWHPAPRVQSYLETGLHGSFSDYPESQRSGPPAASPLNLDVEEAVSFLESQLESRRDRHR